MTATGALIARHVTDLFPTQTSRFDLAQAARRGVIAPLRCDPHPARPGRAHASPRCRCAGARWTSSSTRRCWPSCSTSCRSTSRSPTSTRRASTACPASSTPPACATPTTSPRRSATVGHQGRGASRARRPSASWPRSSPRYERGDIDVLVNAQLLAEGWNSPRATVCMHLAPTASKRIYQQRVGRVTRRHPGKEAGIVVDFVHPATKHDDPVVTLHSLLDRDVYRGGAIVVGPVRRGRGRRVRVERRVAAGDRRRGPAARGLRARAVADRRRAPATTASSTCGPRWPARASRRTAGAARGRCCTSTARASSSAASCSPRSQRNRNAQLRLRALQEIAAARDAEALRPRDRRSIGELVARRAPRGREGRCSRRSPRSASAAATRPTPGSGAWPSTRARCTRSTRCSAGRRPSACSGCSSTPPAAPTRATRAGSCTPRASRTAASRPRCSPPRWRTRPRPRRCCAARATRMARKPSRARARAAAQLPQGAARRGRAARGAARARAATAARASRRRARAAKSSRQQRRNGDVARGARREGARTRQLRRRRSEAGGVEHDEPSLERLREHETARAPGRRHARRASSSADDADAGWPRQPSSVVHLAGVERRRSPSVRTSEAARRRRPLRHAAAVRRSTRSRGRAARRARGTPPRTSSCGAASSQRAERARAASRSAALDVAPVASPASPRSRAAPAGGPPSARATLTPIPTPPSPPAGGPRRGSRRPCARSIQTSLGHLIRGLARPRTSATATAAASGSSRRRGRAARRDIEQRARPAARSSVRPWRPRPAVCAGRGDERAVRRPGDRQLAGAVVGRVGLGEVEARRAERSGRRAHAAGDPQLGVVAQRRAAPPRRRG